MAAPEKPIKINLKVVLKSVPLKDIMPDNWDAKENPTDRDKLISDLQAEIDKAGVSEDRVYDLPLKLRVTHGADVYKLADLIYGLQPNESSDKEGEK